MEYYSVDELELEENEVINSRTTNDHFNTKVEYIYFNVRNIKLLLFCIFIVSFCKFPTIITLYMVLAFDSFLPESEDDIQIMSVDEVLKQISHEDFIGQNPPIMDLISPIEPDIDDYFGLVETTLNTENALSV
jgi:hypothetical protein